MRVKLRQISHALAVWRHGGFRRAAEQEHLSQPALSRSVLSLEEALGVPLFDRQANEIRLTPYGEVFLQRAANLLAEAADLEREMSFMKGQEVGHFSVAMGMTAAQASGVRAGADLLRKHPTLQVWMETRSWRDVERLVRNRQVDIGLSEIAQLRAAPDLHIEPVGRHELVFYCRAGHPLLTRASAVTLGDLDDYPYVGAPIPRVRAHLFPRNHRPDEGSDDLLPPIMVEDTPAAATVVACTDALSAAPPVLIEPQLRSGALVAVPLRRPWLRLDYGFIALPSRSVSPAVESFKMLVRKAERKLGQRNVALVDELFGGDTPAAAGLSAAPNHSSSRASRSISAGVQPVGAASAIQAAI
jgi:DNA-binding transcriptional LysR family regulator